MHSACSKVWGFWGLGSEVEGTNPNAPDAGQDCPHRCLCTSPNNRTVLHRALLFNNHLAACPDPQPLLRSILLTPVVYCLLYTWGLQTCGTPARTSGNKGSGQHLGAPLQVAQEAARQAPLSQPGLGLPTHVQEDLVHAQALRCAKALQHGLDALAGGPATGGVFSPLAPLLLAVVSCTRLLDSGWVSLTLAAQNPQKAPETAEGGSSAQLYPERTQKPVTQRAPSRAGCACWASCHSRHGQLETWMGGCMARRLQGWLWQEHASRLLHACLGLDGRVCVPVT